MAENTSRVIAEIDAERRRQVEAEGWTPEHDDQHSDGSLAAAAACYAAPPGAMGRRYEKLAGQKGRWLVPKLWPWDPSCWRPKSRRRDLIRAAALIVAEIERLDRAEAKEAGNA